MKNYETYFSEHREEHIEQLKDWLRIPSVSALSEHKQDMQKAAGWAVDALKTAGLENVKLHTTNGNPVIYADYLHSPNAPTLLIYGHYDVQPVDPLNLWDSPPFEPEIRGDKIYARGATDDKGQVFLHIKAIEAILKTEQKLPVNIKFCIEGEEEVGSPNLPIFIESNLDLLKCDYVLVSDTSLLEKGKPAICTGLRGLCSMEVKVTTANTDLHSGSFGGGVPNALHAMVSLLSSFHDEHGKVTVEGFYEGTPEMTPELRAEFAKLQHDDDKLAQSLELSSLYGEEEFTFVERIGARPTLELNGVYGGFQGEGSKTVIPREANAKITCRLVGKQDPQDILNKIERHVNQHIQKGAKVEFTPLERAFAFTMDPSLPILQQAADSFEAVYGTRAVFTRDGGSLPIIESMSRILSAPAVLMGFGLPDENLHAPNEHFNLENFDKGLLTITHFLKSLEA